MFGWPGTLNSAQTAEIAAEPVIYHGCKAAESLRLPLETHLMISGPD